MGYFILYCFMSLVIGTLLLRHDDPDIIDYILTGKFKPEHDNDSEFMNIFVIIIVYLLWPIIILCYGFYYIFIWFLWDKITIKGLRKLIRFILDTIPEFDIKIKEKPIKKKDEKAKNKD